MKKNFLEYVSSWWFFAYEPNLMPNFLGYFLANTVYKPICIFLQINGEFWSLLVLIVHQYLLISFKIGVSNTESQNG